MLEPQEQTEFETYEFDNPETGETYEIEVPVGTPADVVGKEVDGFMSSLNQSQPQPTETFINQTPQPVPDQLTPEPQYRDVYGSEHYEAGLDNFLDFSSDAENLSKQVSDRVATMARDPNVPISEINNLLLSQGNGFRLTPQAVESIRKARSEGTPLGPVQLEDPLKDLIDEEKITEEYAAVNTDWFSQTARSMTEAWADPASLTNWISRNGSDLFDTYKEEIKEKYPDLSEEELDRYEDAYIARLTTLNSQAAQAAVSEDDMIPWLAGQLFAVEPTDLIPFAKGAKAGTRAGRLLEKGVQTAGASAATDVLGQGLAIADNVQEEFDPLRTAASAALGGVMGAGAQRVGEGVIPGRMAPNDNPEGYRPKVTEQTIVAPTAKKGTRAYRKQIEESNQAIADRINRVQETWEGDVPQAIVHNNFNRLKNTPNNALAVHRTKSDGSVEVIYNAERIMAKAKAKGVSPDDVVTGLVFHENLGHHALKTVYGASLDDAMRNLYNKGSTSFKRLVDDWMSNNPNSYRGDNRVVRATEEVLAEMSEKSGKIERSIYDKVIDFFKAFSQRFLGQEEQFSVREVRSILSTAQDSVTKGSKQKTDSYAHVDKFSDDYKPSDSTSAGFRRRGPDTRDFRKTVKETREMKRRAQDEADEKYGRREMDDRYNMSNYEDLDINDLSPDELFDSENALDILKALTRDKGSGPISFDDIHREAVMRNVPASALLRLNERDPAELARRIFQYDIAAQKMNQKVTRLYAKIQSANYTAADKQEYLKTIFAFEELSKRIFGLQSELGRALRAVREVDYTRNKVTLLRDALDGMLDQSGGLELLDNPEVFERFAKEVQDAIDNTDTKGTSDKVASYLNVPRALMSSTDLSAPLRQGLYFMPRKEWWAAIPKMFKYLVNQDAFEQLMYDITKMPNYKHMQKAGIAFTDVDNSSIRLKEEAYQTDVAQKIPIIGRAVKMSERAYVGFLNKLRADIFSNIVDGYKDPNGKLLLDDKELHALATFVNAGTGRGTLNAKEIVYGRASKKKGDRSVLEASAPLLNATFFSPRLMSSRAMLLNLGYYATLPPEIRKIALSQLAANGITGTVIMTTLYNVLTTLMPDEDIEIQYDPRSSDFGKVRIGSQRWDVMGGFGQYVTLGARLFTGQRLSSTGKEYSNTSSDEVEATQQAIRFLTFMDDEAEPINPIYAGTPITALLDFGRNKLSPNASFVVDVGMGENAIGEKTTVLTAAGQRMVPLFLQDWYEAVEAHGFERGTFSVAPVLFGVGYSDYTPVNIDRDQELEAPESFDMKDVPDGSNEYATSKNGTIQLKPLAQKFWQDSINKHFKLIIENEVSDEQWSNLSKPEKEELIKDAKKEAKKYAKEELLTYIGLE